MIKTKIEVCNNCKWETVHLCVAINIDNVWIGMDMEVHIQFCATLATQNPSANIDGNIFLYNH